MKMPIPTWKNYRQVEITMPKLLIRCIFSFPMGKAASLPQTGLGQIQVKQIPGHWAPPGFLSADKSITTLMSPPGWSLYDDAPSNP